MNTDYEQDVKFTEGVATLARTGATQFQMRWCGGGDDAEEPPIAWVAVAVWAFRWECAAAADPITAVMRLCEQVIDGGKCTHCGLVTAFDPDWEGREGFDIVPGICWYVWDPELRVFRRSCEGIAA